MVCIFERLQCGVARSGRQLAPIDVVTLGHTCLSDHFFFLSFHRLKQMEDASDLVQFKNILSQEVQQIYLRGKLDVCSLSLMG